jgi:hypothetical protein
MKFITRQLQLKFGGKSQTLVKSGSIITGHLDVNAFLGGKLIKHYAMKVYGEADV